ncbi:hypothetical protein MKX03_015444, partial [Papaver bracteatum]
MASSSMGSMSRFLYKDCSFQSNTSTLCKSASLLSPRRVQINFESGRRGVSLSSEGRCLVKCSVQRPISAFSLTNPSLIAKTSGRQQVLCQAEASGSVPGSTPELITYEIVVERLTTLFPIWVLILGTVIGIYKPLRTWLETDLFTVVLGFLMLLMGLTLKFDDFRRCLRNPWTVGVGFLAQYMIKPLLGFFISISILISQRHSKWGFVLNLNPLFQGLDLANTGIVLYVVCPDDDWCMCFCSSINAWVTGGAAGILKSSAVYAPVT